MKNHSIHALSLAATTLALGAIQSSAQMIWNGSVGNDMANASNYSGTGTRTWNGTQAGNLSLTATAGVNGTFNYLSGQTGTVTVNGGANTFINDNNSTFLMEAGAGAVTWSNLVFQQGTATAANRTFTFRNNSVNDLTFDSSVSITRVGTVGSGNARNLTFDGTGVVRIEGSIANMGNFATLTKSNSGTLVLSGSNSYVGTTAVSAGTLLATKAAALPGYNLASKVTVANGATLAVRAGAASDEWISTEIASLLGATTAAFASGSNLGIEVTTGNTFSYASDVGTTQAAKGLVKTGTGTLTLSATNTYTGLTTVSAGTLAVNGSVAGAMSVASGATLQGSGTISGNTTVSGNLKPGNSPGLLTFANSLTLDSTAVTTMEITGANSSGTRGVTYDAVNVGSALTYGGTLSLNFDTLFTQTGNYTFNLFDFNPTSGSFGSVSLAGVYSGSFTDNSGIWGLTQGDNNWSFNQGDGILTFTVIPEPNVAMVAGSLALMALLRRRRD